MRLKLITKLIIAIFAISFTAFYGCSKDSGKKVVVKGSTTVLPITQMAAEAFKKKNGISVTIEGSGSGNGIKAILDGSTDIANSSREMKKEELAKAKESGLKIKEIICAYDLIVPVIHSSNPVTNLTTLQMKGIYDGSIKNWKQVGGKDEAIVVVSRDSSSGTYEVWHEKVMKKTDVSKEALLQASNGAILSTVGENPKAIGYIGIGYLNNKVKAINVNGVEATIENGKSGNYPVFRALYMYVNEEKYSDEAKAFVDFILSEEGQKLVKEAGFFPI